MNFSLMFNEVSIKFVFYFEVIYPCGGYVSAFFYGGGAAIARAAFAFQRNLVPVMPNSMEVTR